MSGSVSHKDQEAFCPKVGKMYQKALICSLICSIISSMGMVCASKHKALRWSEGVQPPTLLKEAELVYSQEARANGLQGKVDMYLLVTEKGGVKQVKVVQSSGYAILDDAATQYGKNLKFKPATREGKPTGIWVTWSVDFCFETVETMFILKEYVTKVKAKFRLAERCSGKKRESILGELLKLHEQFVQQLSEKPGFNYNPYIQEFLEPRVYEQWSDNAIRP